MLSLPYLSASALVTATLTLAKPALHYPRQVANSTITSSGAAITGTAAHNCSWTWDQWLSSSLEVQYTNLTNLTSTYTYYNITASLTTECDGRTRIVGDLTTIATGTNTTFTSTSHNYTVPPPTCTPEQSECSQFNIGFGTYPCPRPTNSASKSCGQCSIWGGTVDLLYFPITEPTTSHTLCPDPTVSPGSATTCPLGPTTASRNATNPYDYQPCYYATDNTSSTTNSGPYVVSDGHTFYQNRAYISLQTAYASDGCGIVGGQHTGTILELKSQDVYSVGGYHHEFQDAGYQFNFQDLEAVPSYAYYLDCGAGGPASCAYSGTRYRYGTDFLNGHSDIDLGQRGGPNTDSVWIWQEAYTPMLLLPTQIRDLDPAWSTCSLNLGGLYDPPKALTQAPSGDGPTQPTPDPGNGGGGGGTTAQPGNGPTTPGPTPTALPDNNPTPTGGNGGAGPTTPSEPEPTDGDGGDDGGSNGGNDDGGNGGGDGGSNDGGNEDENGEGNGGGNDGGDDSGSGGGNDDGNGSGDNGGNDGGSDGGSGGGDNSQDGSGTDDGSDSGSNGGSGSGDSDDSGNDQQNPGEAIASILNPAPTTTQGLGEIIASVIGAGSNDQEDGGDAPEATAAPGTDSNDNSGDDTSNDSSGSEDNDSSSQDSNTESSDGSSNNDDPSDESAPAAAPVTFTDASGSTQTISPVALENGSGEGSSDVFVVDSQTFTAGGSAIEVDGVTISAGSSGQIVAGTQTLTAIADAAATGSNGGSGGVPTGSDGQIIAISTVAAGTSGVYVADGTTLSVGGNEVVVDGATLSAAPTGVIDVNSDSSGSGSGSASDEGDDGASDTSSADSSSDGASATGSASGAQQTGNTASSPLAGKGTWLSSAAACIFAGVVAML